jgi:hypothetical protein
MTTLVSEELLILTKTYPSPSAKYRETTCVAAVTRQGEMRRLFPVPYRLLEGTAQFKKWEWIHARVVKPEKDHRPESYRIDADSIERSDNVIKTKAGDWSDRLKWIENHVVEGFASLELRRQQSGRTLGFIRPVKLLGLKITRVSKADWTEEDKIKLSQDGLFDSHQIKARPPLRKLPYDFHYQYVCADGEQTHKLTDWEVGALYWKCVQAYGPKWESKFRQRLELEFRDKDLHFLMGTIHRFPDQWLIVGLVYPPRLQAKPAVQQLGLGLGL